MWFLWFLAFRKYKIQYNWHCSYGFWPSKAIRIILIYVVLMASGISAIRTTRIYVVLMRLARQRYKNHYNLHGVYGFWPPKAIRTSTIYVVIAVSDPP